MCISIFALLKVKRWVMTWDKRLVRRAAIHVKGPEPHVRLCDGRVVESLRAQSCLLNTWRLHGLVQKLGMAAIRTLPCAAYLAEDAPRKYGLCWHGGQARDGSITARHLAVWQERHAGRGCWAAIHRRHELGVPLGPHRAPAAGNAHSPVV